MPVRLSSRMRLLFLAAAAAALPACATHSGTTQFLPQNQFGSMSSAIRFAVPPMCKGQKTFGNHASDSEKLLASGGSLCIPEFSGFGGSVKYPPANPSVGITLISSTTNYTGKLPKLHSGTALFYLQIATTGGTTLGSNVQAGGGLTGAKIVPGKIYTVYGQAVVEGFVFNFTPCFTKATSGPFGGVIGGIGTLLKGQSIPVAASGVIEVYPGKSASGAC